MTQTLIVTPTSMGFQDLGFEPEELDPGLSRTAFSIGDEHYRIVTETGATLGLGCDYIFCLRMPADEAQLATLMTRLLMGGILGASISETEEPHKMKFWWVGPVDGKGIEEALRRWQDLSNRINACQ